MPNTLVDKTEEELWKLYRKAHDPKIRDHFVRQYAPLVKYVAGKVAIGMPHNVEFDDLVGFGVFGLFDAIEKFDPEKHVKFKTYAVTRIRGSIFDELRSIDWVPCTKTLYGLGKVNLAEPTAFPGPGRWRKRRSPHRTPWPKACNPYPSTASCRSR